MEELTQMESGKLQLGNEGEKSGELTELIQTSLDLAREKKDYLLAEQALKLTQASGINTPDRLRETIDELEAALKKGEINRLFDTELEEGAAGLSESQIFEAKVRRLIKIHQSGAYLLSVIMPAYNEEQLIPEALQSIRGQRFNGLVQVVVADNGSKDQTVVIVEKYGVNVTRESEPGSIGSARYDACRRAETMRTQLALSPNSEIVISTDADSEIYPGFLRAVEQAYKEDNNLMASMGPVKLIFPSGKTLVLGNSPQRILGNTLRHLDVGGFNYLFERFGQNDLAFTGANLVARRIALGKAGGFDPRHQRLEDLSLALRLNYVLEPGQKRYVSGQGVITSPRDIVNDRGKISPKEFLKAWYEPVNQRWTKEVIEEYRDWFAEQNTRRK